MFHFEASLAYVAATPRSLLRRRVQVSVERDPAHAIALGDAADRDIGVAQQRPDLTQLLRPELGPVTS